jgi:hypothetical protein
VSDKRTGSETVERTVAQIRDSIRSSGGRVTDERQIRRDVEKALQKRDQREGK